MNDRCPTCGRADYHGAVPPEPPIGTWMRDRHGAVTMRQADGWGEPGTHPGGDWAAMWDARGPYVECEPWGVPSLSTKETEK